ncbi:MAG: permease-like cell division protein FtsX, partial [Patescibacteria group bacterium]
DISVYFKSNVPEDSILSVKRSLESLEEVREAVYVSREDALTEFKERHKEDETIVQTLEELDENPLLGSLNVKAKELEQYETIASYLETPSLKDIIEKVTFAQNELVIRRLSSLVATLNRSIVLLTIFLAFLAIMVTFNTIRLAIFANSEEIGIMRLVGASNSFIKGPFLVEGVIYGIISAVISFILFIPVILIISPHLGRFVHELDLATYLGKNWGTLLLYQLLFALILATLSSAFAIRRYLRK